MPYKNPEKQRQAMRKIMREYRKRRKAELETEIKKCKDALHGLKRDLAGIEGATEAIEEYVKEDILFLEVLENAVKNIEERVAKVDEMEGQRKAIS